MNEELKIILTAETADMKKQVKSAQKTIKDYVHEGTKDMKSLGDEMKKYSDKTNKLLKSAGVAVVGATTALLGLSAATADYRNAQAKLKTAFESAGGTAKEAKRTYRDLYKVLGDSDTSVEAANHLAKLTTNQKELKEWTSICQGVYATFGDSLPIEGLTEAANETAKVGQVTGTLADALNWAGVNEDAFNEQLAACNTEAEREALIRGTLNGLYKEASETFAENNSQVMAQHEAQARLSDVLAKVGEAISPINTMLTELGADILEDLTPYIEEFCADYLPKLKNLLKDVGKRIGEVIKWIADHWNMITTIGGIVLAVSVAISAVSTAIGIYNTVMAIAAAVSAPVSVVVLAIVAAVAALSAAIYLCVKHWDKIKKAVSSAVSSMKQKVNSLKDSISNVMERIKSIISNGWAKVKSFFKLPHFSVSGDLSLVPPSVPKISVDWYANGGVFDKPTLFPYGNGSLGGLGEAGAEAVVPLEKNTQWLDRIAERLQGNKSPVVLMVDGKVFGEIAVDSINSLTRQRGSLPLQLV